MTQVFGRCVVLVGLAAVGGVSGARAEVGIVEAPIVDGRRASAGEILATVSLTDSSGESVCTGTLIAPRVVVTAAHCLVQENEETGQVISVNSAGDIEVVAGVLDVAEASGSQRYAVAEVIVHEGYPNETASSHVSGAARYDDVGVLILERAVAGMTPAVVPTVSEAMALLDGGASVTITGYGATSANTDDSGVLYTAETSFEVRVDAEIVLGGPSEPDTCPGDSGGPAYLKSGSATWLVGVTSRASENAVATCGEGGVYAFAPVYRDWFVANSQGLYSASPTGPVDPEEPVDPGEELGENCELVEEDGEFYEECYDEEEGCAGGGGFGFVPGAVLALGLMMRRRR